MRDYAQVKADGVLTVAVAREALDKLAVDACGLDRTDRELLKVMITKFSGGPVGLGTLAAATSEEMDTIEVVYEPFLLQMGFIQRTPRGRMATENAYKHLGLPVPKRFSQSAMES